MPLRGRSCKRVYVAATSINPASLFIRDDDVGELTDALRFFVEAFFEREIPVSYQIIPAKLTRYAADYLLEKWHARPDLIELGQHGLAHQMTVRGQQVWREFGPERSFAEQSAKIQEGLGILRAHLEGGPPIRVFTPPQHKYNGSTVRAAAQSGHRVFSGSSYPSVHHQLAYKVGRGLGLSSLRHHGISYHGRVRPEGEIVEISVSIAVDNGGSLLWSASSIDTALEQAAGTSAMVGLMFHHALYNPDVRRAELCALADRFATLASAGGKFQLLEPLASDVLESGAPAGAGNA